MGTCASEYFPDGEELARRLRGGEGFPLGRPYALYVIALATEIDEAELAWLKKYSRAIDSLTGRAIAFVLFFNSLKRPSPSPVGSASVPDRGPDFTRDWERFARSMTYESDNFARAFGVHPSDLPCLVLVDDPDGRDFYTQPMIGSENHLLDLRKLVGDFYALPECKEYVRRLEDWDRLHAELSMILTRDDRSSEIAQALTDFGSPTAQKQGLESELDMRCMGKLQLMRRADASLRSMSRPEVLPILNKLKWGRRRQSAKSLATATGLYLKENAEAVLKAVELAIKGQQAR